MLSEVLKNYVYKHENASLFLLSAIVGIIGGFGAVFFRHMINLNRTLFFDYLLPNITFYVGGYNVGVIALPALGGLVVGPLIYWFAREAKGHGVPEVIEAVHLKGGFIRPVVAFVKIVVSSVTIGSGGSAGREGPIAQIGAVFGSFIGGSFFRNKKHVRLMVCCGVAAGISATFNAPLGGALFSMEVISTYTGLVTSIPILLAAVIGNVVSANFFGFAPAIGAPLYTFQNISEIPLFFAIGILFGFLSFVWCKVFYGIEGAFDSLHFPEMFKPVIGGALVGVLGMIFLQYGIMGVGYDDINAAVVGKLSIEILLLLGVTKLLATSFTIGSGGSGGVFAPTLYIGAMFGAATGLFAQHLFPTIIQNPGAFALIGMGALFAGSARAPITSLVMIPEMTNNYHLLIPMIIVSTMSYLIASVLNRSSIYLMKLEQKGLKINKKENPLEDIPVGDVMSRELDSVSPDTKLSVILSLMMERKHPGFPVVNGNNRFYGFVKIYDLKKIRKSDMDRLSVRDVVANDYPHVSPADNVYHALNIMVHHNLGRIPVLVKRKGEHYIVGVISKTDVIKAYEELME